MSERLLKYIHMVMLQKDIKSDAELARRMGVSPQTLAGKFGRNNLKESDIEAIAEAMGVEFRIVFFDPDTGKEY